MSLWLLTNSCDSLDGCDSSFCHRALTQTQLIVIAVLGGIGVLLTLLAVALLVSIFASTPKVSQDSTPHPWKTHTTSEDHHTLYGGSYKTNQTVPSSSIPTALPAADPGPMVAQQPRSPPPDSRLPQAVYVPALSTPQGMLVSYVVHLWRITH